MNIEFKFKNLRIILKDSRDSVIFGLKIVDIIKDNIPSDQSIPNTFLRLKFEEDYSIDEQKKIFKNWILKKGFEDLIKGIEYFLKETCILLFDKHGQGDSKDNTYLELKEKNDKLHIPDLLDKIEGKLKTDLKWKEEILSINKARNCLMHRNGIVSTRDINTSENTLKLKWIDAEVNQFQEKNGIKLPLKGTMATVSSGFGNECSFIVEANLFKCHEVSFKINDEITINYIQYNGLVWTCQKFAEKLIESLPKKVK